MPRSRSASTTWNGLGLWCEHHREPATTRFLGCIRLPFSQPITKARFLNKERAARFLRTRTARRCPRDLGGQRMQGAIEALLSGLVRRGLGPVLSGILMAAPLKKVARAQLKKIYVLDERGEMAGEYVLDQDCPIDYSDFLKVLPDEGIGDRDSLFVGEYVFTAFQSGKFVFVLLSRGQLAPEDVNWTALLLTAADSHLASAANRPASARAAEPKPDVDKGIAERDARLQAKEKSLAELEARYQEASAGIAQLEKEAKASIVFLEKERAETAVRSAEEEKTRREIESRVADLSQRFTSMAKERLVASHRPPGEVSDEVRKAMEGEKAELARERKFLQRRAIELLDREERVRDREARVEERDREFGRRDKDLSAREEDLDRQRTLLAQAKPQAPEIRAEPDEAKKDIERRVTIIQQKALDLLDREEKLRRRAAELEAMESRLSGRVTVE